MKRKHYPSDISREQFERKDIKQVLRSTVTQMVYKHSISTVVPAKPVTLDLESTAGPAR